MLHDNIDTDILLNTEDDMGDGMKQIIKLIIIIVVVLIIAPWIIATGTSADILNWATNDNDWIGFWGSYVGTFLGSIITLIVLFVTLKDNSLARKREEKLEYYNQIIDDYAKFIATAVGYLDYVKRTIMFPNTFDYEEYRKIYLLVAVDSIKISIRLKIKETTGTKEIFNWIDNVTDEINEIKKELKDAGDGDFNFFDKQDELMKKVNRIYVKIDAYEPVISKILKKELEL